MNSSGVNSIDSATASSSCLAMCEGITPLLSTSDSSTKPNSPACASASAKSFWSSRFRRNTLPSSSRIRPLAMITHSVMPRIFQPWWASSSKSTPAPTVMKNSPSSSPLNGSMLLSSSCRYSLLASTTPARKVPSAGESPISDISTAMPMTSASDTTVKISRSRAAAM